MIPECVVDFLFNVLLVNLVGIGIALGTTIEEILSEDSGWESLWVLLLTVIFWPITIGIALARRCK